MSSTIDHLFRKISKRKQHPFRKTQVQLKANTEINKTNFGRMLSCISSIPLHVLIYAWCQGSVTQTDLSLQHHLA